MHTEGCQPGGVSFAEDWMLGHCLASMGIDAVDTRDEEGPSPPPPLRSRSRARTPSLPCNLARLVRARSLCPSVDATLFRLGLGLSLRLRFCPNSASASD